MSPTRSLLAALSSAAIVFSAVIQPSPVFASSGDADAAPPEIAGIALENEEPDVRIRPLDHTVDLATAETIYLENGAQVVGYQFSNAGTWGQYQPTASRPIAEFLDDYERRYDTQPQIVAVIVEVPPIDAKHSS